jgi:acyl-CoA thioester hydrolase
VWFRDVDSFGHVNNAAFCSYLETARFKYFKDRLGSFDDARFVLARAEIDYISPLGLEETAVVEMWTGDIGNSSWEFLYKIVEKESSRDILNARTVQVWYDLEKMRSVPIPDNIREILEKDRIKL